jgi:hypothetical protein
MKFWSLVLCVVILVLGFMPCSDSNAAIKPLANTYFEQGHQGTNPTQDHCTPFCHCSCCNTPSVTAMRPLLFTIPVAVVRNYPELRTLNIENRNLVIWQPPKLIA